MAEKKTDRGIPGEERFIATGKKCYTNKTGQRRRTRAGKTAGESEEG